MDDLEDVLEAFDDIEDIAEEIFEPEDLIEDFEAEPLTIVVGLVAALAGGFTLLMLLLLLVLFLLRFGLFAVVATLTVLGILATVLSIGVFLYVRSGIPHSVQRKINDARSRAYEEHDEETASEEELAIEELREAYAEGNIDEQQLEDGLDRVLESDNPEAVVHEYERNRENGSDSDRDYEYE